MKGREVQYLGGWLSVGGRGQVQTTAPDAFDLGSTPVLSPYPSRPPSKDFWVKHSARSLSPLHPQLSQSSASMLFAIDVALWCQLYKQTTVCCCLKISLFSSG